MQQAATNRGGKHSAEQPCSSGDAASAPGFVAVPVSTLFPSMVVGVPLYIRDDGQTSMRLYRGADYPFEAKDIAQLLERGVKNLYVASHEYARYQRYLRDNLAAYLQNEKVPVQRRFANLNGVVRDVLAESFAKDDVDEAVTSSKELAQHTVELICRDDVAATQLCSVLYHDYQTFTHSANVAYYSVMLAMKRGLNDKAELNALATGALLHDLGKLEVPDAILNKPGRLTDSEFATIKRHPTLGFRRLCDRADMTFAQLMMVYQHHERLNGTGYPVRLAGEEIQEWSRLCAVVDVFEALTSDRPYRRGYSYAEAFTIMDRDAGSGLDEGMYRCWKETIAGS